MNNACDYSVAKEATKLFYSVYLVGLWLVFTTNFKLPRHDTNAIRQRSRLPDETYQTKGFIQVI